MIESTQAHCEATCPCGESIGRGAAVLVDSGAGVVLAGHGPCLEWTQAQLPAPLPPVFPSKRPGVCRCGEPVSVGERIYWRRGAGVALASHPDCREWLMRQTGGRRPLVSKFDGRCRSCGEGYSEGDEIVWRRGVGAVPADHPGCVDWLNEQNEQGGE